MKDTSVYYLLDLDDQPVKRVNCTHAKVLQWLTFLNAQRIVSEKEFFANQRSGSFYDSKMIKERAKKRLEILGKPQNVVPC